MAAFIPGAKLCGLFYEEAVKPLLAAHFPNLRYAAARIDSGSDVLGFDTPQSTDHDWGPRLMLFVSEADRNQYASAIIKMLGYQLPRTFRGFSTHFGQPGEDGARLLEDYVSGPISHRVTIHTLAEFLNDYLALDPAAELTPLDWLTMPEQHLLTVTRGPVYHDEIGEITAVRHKLAYYPHDVWLYLLASQWRRIDQEEPFVGRCGDVGDELGSRVLAARLIRDMMRLCFLMERQYAPYNKWFGSAFARLVCAPQLMPAFEQALAAYTWKDRERYLSVAYEVVAEMHNTLGITEHLEARVSPFYNRPYNVIHSGRFVDALRAQISDTALRDAPLLGGVDQYVDTTDALTQPKLLRYLKSLYR
jgi:hypothetical protein